MTRTASQWNSCLVEGGSIAWCEEANPLCHQAAVIEIDLREAGTRSNRTALECGFGEESTQFLTAMTRACARMNCL
jgi:hypothetical protein